MFAAYWVIRVGGPGIYSSRGSCPSTIGRFNCVSSHPFWCSSPPRIQRTWVSRIVSVCKGPVLGRPLCQFCHPQGEGPGIRDGRVRVGKVCLTQLRVRCGAPLKREYWKPNKQHSHHSTQSSCNATLSAYTPLRARLNALSSSKDTETLVSKTNRDPG